MKKVYVAQHAWDAQMVRDLLVMNGIDAIVDPSYMGLKKPGTAVWIVDDAEEGRAQHVLEAFRAAGPEERQGAEFVWTWRCRDCGEDVEPQFAACWNCGTPRPVE